MAPSSNFKAITLTVLIFSVLLLFASVSRQFDYMYIVLLPVYVKVVYQLIFYSHICRTRLPYARVLFA